MVAASKNFRTKRKQRQVVSAQFSRNSAASAALRATQYRGVQSNNNFASSLLRGENRNLDSQGNPDSLLHAAPGFCHPCLPDLWLRAISGFRHPCLNMTTDQNGNTLKYDAWNRLISVTNSSGQILAEYTYNALPQRVTETYPVAAPGIPANTVKNPGAAAQPRHPASAGFCGIDKSPAQSAAGAAPLNLYYSTGGQILEERWDGTAAGDVQYQYVWSATYVNAMVLRDTFAAGTIQPNLRVYALNDTNYNVTALVTYNAATQTWGVSERFVYSPYGSVEVFDANFVSIPDAFNWQYMYQGGRFDTATGLYHFGARNYSPSLGVWVSQDPAGYINGADRYEFVGDAPILEADPSGRRLTTAQAQADIPQGWTVSATPNLIHPRIADPNGPATTTESGWIFRTYTTVEPEIRMSTYHVRAEKTIFVPGHNGMPAQCKVKFKTFTVIRIRQITVTKVTNNANAINNTATALDVAGSATALAGGYVAMLPGGQVAGGITALAGGAGGFGGLVLGWAAGAEEASPSTTITLGSVLHTTVLP